MYSCLFDSVAKKFHESCLQHMRRSMIFHGVSAKLFINYRGNRQTNF